MNIGEATVLAKQLISEHGLIGWSFKLNKNKRQLGICKEHIKQIELSEHFVTRNSDHVVLDTILHEIAHALVGTEHGHDAVWKEMCLKLNCTPKSCDHHAQMPEGYWSAKCPSCRKVFNRHRKPRNIRGLYCVACGPGRGSLAFSNIKITYQKRAGRAAQNGIVQLMLKIF